MMYKDFDSWNHKKKDLEIIKSSFLFHEQEVWWSTVGLNIGEESCGKGSSFRRPVLVIKKLSGKNFIGIPISTQKREGTWFTDLLINGEKQYALLHQVRMFSVNRFQRRLTTIDSDDFKKIKQKLELLLELSDNHQSRSSGSVGNPKSNCIIK